MRIFKPRDCHTCSSIFTPTGPKNVWCSELCRMLDCCDHSGGDDTCWDWKLGLDKGGYGHGKFDGKEKAAHRAMYRAYYKCTLHSDQVVRHKCDRRICINPHHLEIGTHADNIRDMWKRGRQQDYKGQLKGSDHHNATIDDHTVMMIFHTIGKCNDIARVFGVSCGIVERIKRGVAWSHLTGANRTFGRRSGESSPNRRITSEDAIAIYNSIEKATVVGRRYGVSSVTVANIRNGKAWRSVTQQ